MENLLILLGMFLFSLGFSLFVNTINNKQNKIMKKSKRIKYKKSFSMPLQDHRNL